MNCVSGSLRPTLGTPLPERGRGRTPPPSVRTTSPRKGHHSTSLVEVLQTHTCDPGPEVCVRRKRSRGKCTSEVLEWVQEGYRGPVSVVGKGRSLSKVTGC